MDEKSEREVFNFPGAGEQGEAARQARVRSLKRRIGAAQYRLDPEAVAGAMLAEGAFSAPTPHQPSATDEGGLRRAMAHFVVSSELQEPAEDSGERTASA